MLITHMFELNGIRTRDPKFRRYAYYQQHCRADGSKQTGLPSQTVREGENYHAAKPLVSGNAARKRQCHPEAAIPHLNIAGRSRPAKKSTRLVYLFYSILSIYSI